MARKKTHTVFGRQGRGLPDDDVATLRARYLEQLPTIAAILASDSSPEDAVDEALDIIEASLEAIQDEEG